MRYQVNDLNMVTRVGSGKLVGPDGGRVGDYVEIKDGQITGLLSRPAARCSVFDLLSAITIDELDLLFESNDPKVSALIRKLTAYSSTGVSMSVNARMHQVLKDLETKGVLVEPRADEIYTILGGNV